MNILYCTSQTFLFLNKLTNRPRLGGEVNADTEQFAGIGCVGASIALLFDLPQGLLGRAIQLEFEDIDVVGHLHDAIHPSLALLFLDEDGVEADHAEHEIDGILEVALTFRRITLLLHPVGGL